MDAERIRKSLRQGEGPQIEFKSCTNEVSSSVYESVCSFSNRIGGLIILGVEDNGTVIGVNPACAQNMVKNIINVLGNRETFQPTLHIEPEIIGYEGKTLIAIDVPVSVSPCRYKNKCFDRTRDADQNVTDSLDLMLSVFERKSSHIFEDRIVEGLEMKDLDPSTFEYCRKVLRVINGSHPWLGMSDGDILNSCKLRKKNASDKTEAYTYASLLLFGTEDAISNYLPGYKFELLFHKMTYGRFRENRPEDIVRYDDRMTLRKNIIQSYCDMMDFIKRYLPDKFYLPTEGWNTSRMDLRVQLFREIIGNLCAHSDYSRQCAGYLEIFYDRVITRNATRIVPEIGEGNLSLDELGIYTKNPLIVKVLSQLQWVEDLGSGKRNIKIYAPLYYDGYEASIKSGQQFEFSITYQNPDAVSGQESGGKVGGNGGNSSVVYITERQQIILRAIEKDPKLAAEKLAEITSLSTRTVERELKALKDQGIIVREGKTRKAVWIIVKH